MAYKRISPMPVVEGGTGNTTLAIHGVLIGNSASAITATVAGTTGQVLTGVTGAAPTFQTAPSGISTLDADTGSATGSTVTIAGTANEITTTASSATLTISIPSSPSFGGTTTVATGLTVTAGDISLPATTSSSVGVINIGGLPFIQAYGATTDQNTFVGQNAGNFTLTSGTATLNTGIGSQALGSLTTGNGNSACGIQNLFSCQSGNANAAIGTATLYNVTSGSFNIGMGWTTGAALTTGGHNVLIGPYIDTAGATASAYTSGESNNIIISNLGVTGESNVIRIGTQGTGNGQQNLCYIAGIFGTTVGVSGVPVVIDNTGNLGTVVSSARFKENIKDMGSTSLMKLRPVTFNYKKDPNKNLAHGLIAEEVQEVLPHLVVYDPEGQPYSVKYHEMPAILLNELQHQSKIIQNLSERIEKLEGK